MPMNSRDGIRVSAADGYLPLGATPPNLTIRGDAQVASIVFEGTTAVGVRLLDGTVVAAELVVICAGVYESPALLMRSGIGPAVQLGPLGIRVLVDLSGVGENLADHPSIDLDCGFSGGPSTDPALHAIATFHSSGRSTRLPPDLMFWLSDPEGDPAEVWISIVLLKPESRGNVRLRSASPTDQPLITLPSLTTTFDLERLTEGYGRAVEIASDLALRRLFAPTTPPDIQAHIRAELFSVPHVVGTCAMGPDPADGAVVDRDCRVHGTERLHVVDASVMPDVPSGFTHMPTLMIAERIADVILHGSP
jgi:choline dehydrogenase